MRHDNNLSLNGVLPVFSNPTMKISSVMSVLQALHTGTKECIVTTQGPLDGILGLLRLTRSMSSPLVSGGKGSDSVAASRSMLSGVIVLVPTASDQCPSRDDKGIANNVKVPICNVAKTWVLVKHACIVLFRICFRR